MAILTQEQVDFYNDYGYVIVRQLIDQETVEVLRDALQRALNGKHEGMRRWIEKKDPEGRRILAKAERFWNTDPILQNFIQTSKVGEVAGQLMETDEVRLFFDELVYKEPKIGGWIPCHQDYDSFREVSTPRIATAFVATSKVDKENGCMYMIRGSHKWGLIDRIFSFPTTDAGPDDFLRIDVPEPQRSQIIRDSIELEPGDVSFHHGLTIHASYVNDSDRPRIGWAHHYLPSDARYIAANDMVHNHEIEAKDGEPINSKNFPLAWRKAEVIST